MCESYSSKVSDWYPHCIMSMSKSAIKTSFLFPFRLLIYCISIPLTRNRTEFNELERSLNYLPPTQILNHRLKSSSTKISTCGMQFSDLSLIQWIRSQIAYRSSILFNSAPLTVPFILFQISPFPVLFCWILNRWWFVLKKYIGFQWYFHVKIKSVNISLKIMICIRCRFILIFGMFGNVDPLYCPSFLLPIRYSAHPTYDNCLFLYYLRVRLG